MSTATLDLLDFSADDTYRLPLIGKGCTRHVYALSSTVVVKVEPTEFKGQNRAEVDNWIAAQKAGLDHFLATMLGWADDYSWVAMERATPVARSLVPFRRPDIAQQLDEIGITDLHTDNWGMADDGRVVLIDYAM